MKCSQEPDGTFAMFRKPTFTSIEGWPFREFPLKTGHGFADYLLYVDAKAVGVVEAKKIGTTLTGVETQSDKYDHWPAR